MAKTEITEESIINAIRSGEYALALTGAFSYLDGALGATRGDNKERMVGALKHHMPVFTRAMTGGSVTIENLNIWYSNASGSKLTPIQEILYDIRCNIQHDGRVDVVELVEGGRIAVSPGKVELPLGIILGLIAVANEIKDGPASNQDGTSG